MYAVEQTYGSTRSPSTRSCTWRSRTTWRPPRSWPDSHRRRTGTEDPAYHPELEPDAFLTLARLAIGDRATVTRSSPSALLEISGPGVSKASTLALCCAERGISHEEVVAFGDMPNDVEMLTWAGRSYAMGNAHPDVLAAASGRTVANNDDGVAVVIEQLLDGRRSPSRGSSSRSGSPRARRATPPGPPTSPSQGHPHLEVQVRAGGVAAGPGLADPLPGDTRSPWSTATAARCAYWV
ncbi:HMP-PP phosphatase [Streptomyces griseoloalbus]